MSNSLWREITILFFVPWSIEIIHFTTFRINVMIVYLLIGSVYSLRRGQLFVLEANIWNKSITEIISYF